MDKNSITYKIGNSLYLNITNRCLNDCGFCIRRKAKNFNGEHPLWLDQEPTAEEVINAIGDPNQYDQIVFCGYGEPLIRLDEVKEIAKKIRKMHRQAFAKIIRPKPWFMPMWVWKLIFKMFFS